MSNPSVIAFVDPVTDGMSDDHKQLFRDFGLEAYTIIAGMEIQEREHEEQLAWDAVKPLKDGDGSDEEDNDIDMGPLEPDDFGNEGSGSV